MLNRVLVMMLISFGTSAQVSLVPNKPVGKARLAVEANLFNKCEVKLISGGHIFNSNKREFEENVGTIISAGRFLLRSNTSEVPKHCRIELSSTQYWNSPKKVDKKYRDS